MTSISQLGVDQLSLRGSGTDYNILSRFFATKAQADAALADSSWVPTAGKTNGCLTGDQGLLVYDFGTSALVVADSATRAYVDTEVAAAVAALVDSAPGALDTLNELAAAINDDANAYASLTSAIAAVQADVDQNESDSDAAEAALSGRLDVLEADPTTATAVAAVQADVDQNESDADAAIAAVQADVDQNEADADAAIALKANLAGAAFTGDVSTTGNLDVAGNLQIDNDGGYYIHFDRNTATQLDLATGNIPSGGNLNIKNSNGNNARVVVYSDEFWVRNLGGANGNGTAKFDGDVTFGGSISLNGTTVTATGDELNYVDGVTSNIQTQLNAIQADVDQNESDADTAIALKADLAGPTFTGTPAAPTAAVGTSTTQLATTAFVAGEVDALIDGAPAGLNTLNELAAALNDDAAALSNATTLINANETHIDNLVTLSGVAKDAVNLGTFTGSTITDNVVLKVALQELETEVETKLAAETITLTSFKTVVAASSDFADFKTRVAAL